MKEKIRKAIKQHEEYYHDSVIRTSIRLNRGEIDDILTAVFDYWFKGANLLFAEGHREALREHIIKYMND